MNIRTLGVICGILSGFFWGTMDIAAQYLLHTVRMAPAQFISLTMVVTTVALFGISLATRPKETFLVAADKQNVFQFFPIWRFGPSHAGQLLCLCEVLQRRNGGSYRRYAAFLHHGAPAVCSRDADCFADLLLCFSAYRRLSDDDQRKLLDAVLRMADAFGRLRRAALLVPPTRSRAALLFGRSDRSSP